MRFKVGDTVQIKRKRKYMHDNNIELVTHGCGFNGTVIRTRYVNDTYTYRAVEVKMSDGYSYWFATSEVKHVKS